MNKIDLIDRAIESASCRIYRLKANSGETVHHQRKAENQIDLQKITVEALKYYKDVLNNDYYSESMYIVTDAVDFIAERCDVDKETIEKVLSIEEDYMGSLGLIVEE